MVLELAIVLPFLGSQVIALKTVQKPCPFPLGSIITRIGEMDLEKLWVEFTYDKHKTRSH